MIHDTDDAELHYDGDDDWFDDDPEPWERGEPSCWTCDDDRWVGARRGRIRPCPRCNPTRLDDLRHAAWWWTRGAWRHLTSPFRRRDQDFGDEPPF